MISSEWRATLMVALLFAMRMLGLFMILPVIAVYATSMEGASAQTIGWAVGIYGLTQALFQIPFGAWSDKIGRKKVILLGLGLFAFGSLIAATSTSITWLIIGRALQGVGAIGSTLLALLSDLTRTEVRSRAMAIVGVMIGLSFVLAFIVGPLLTERYGFVSIFWFTLVISVLAMLWALIKLPTKTQKSSVEFSFKALRQIFAHAECWRLNVSIFILHAMLTASFLYIPQIIQRVGGEHLPAWQFYLPVLLSSLVIMSPFLRLADKPILSKVIMLSAIFIFGFSQMLVALVPFSITIVAFTMVAFFASFNLLEAMLPSWMSRVAPVEHKGLAMGVYSSCQFLGIFVGGVLGGQLQHLLGNLGITLGCMTLMLIWLACAFDLTKNAPEVVFEQ